MSNKITRHVLSDKIRALREAAGEGQMQFAQRLGWHIVTLARLETKKAPSGKALVDLIQAARELGQHDLAMDFSRALSAEIHLPMPWAHLSDRRLPDGSIATAAHVQVDGDRGRYLQPFLFALWDTYSTDKKTKTNATKKLKACAAILRGE